MRDQLLKNLKIIYLIERTLGNIHEIGIIETIKKIYIYLKKNKKYQINKDKKKIFFATSEKIYSSFINHERDIKHSYLFDSTYQFFEQDNFIHGEKLIITENKYLDASIKVKLKNYKNNLILITNYKYYLNLNPNIKQHIDFLLFKDKPKKSPSVGGYYLYNDNFPFILDKFIQLLYKENFVTIPLIKNSSFNLMLTGKKTIYLKYNLNFLETNYPKNFNQIIDRIEIKRISYLYVSEDLYWYFNNWLQKNNISLIDIKNFLKSALSKGAVVKRIN